MALLTYDGIDLPFNKTESGDEANVYSDDGIDLLHTKRTYTISSVFTTDAIHSDAIVDALPPDANGADLLNLYRCKLNAPRKALKIQFDEGTIIDLAEGEDAKGGPFPEVISLTTFAGTNTCHIRYRITCYTIDCCNDGNPSTNPDGSPRAGDGQVNSPVQWRSNRWEDLVDISGDDFRSVYTRTGKIVIRPGRLIADSFRGMVTPQLIPGFLRTKASYRVASDGLSLSYTFVDEEQWAMPPPGAVKASGTCRISADRGIWRYADVSVHLVGDVRQTKENLLNLAVTVCMAKLRKCGVAKSKEGKWLSTQGAIVEQLYRNEIEVSVRALLQPAKGNQKVNTEKSSLESRQLQNTAIGAGIGTVILPGAGTVVGGVIGYALTSDQQQPEPTPPPPAAMPVPKGLTVDFRGIGSKPWGSEGMGVSPDFGLRSTGGLTLIAAAFRDPCLTEAIDAMRSVPEAEEEEEPGVEPSLTADTTPPAAAPATRELRTGPTVNPDILPPYKPGRAVAPSGGQMPKGPRGEAKSDQQVRAEIQIVDPEQVLSPISTGSGEGDPGISALYSTYELWLKVEEDNQQVVTTEQRRNGRTHVIPIGAPTKKLYVEWTCQRIGEPPTVPDPDLGDDNCVLLRKSYNPGSVELDEQGNLLCSSAGRYEYQFLDPTAADKLGAGLPPWASELLGGLNAPTIYGGPKMIEGGKAVGSSQFISNLDTWRTNKAAADATAEDPASGDGSTPTTTGGTLYELVAKDLPL